MNVFYSSSSIKIKYLVQDTGRNVTAVCSAVIVALGEILTFEKGRVLGSTKVASSFAKGIETYTEFLATHLHFLGLYSLLRLSL